MRPVFGVPEAGLHPTFDGEELIRDLGISMEVRNPLEGTPTSQNGFYGLGRMLARYSRMPDELVDQFVVEHGIPPHPGSSMWSTDLQADARLVLCSHPLRAKLYEAVTGRKALAIGSFIHYARDLVEIGDGPTVRSRRVLLVPIHSTHHIRSASDAEVLVARGRREMRTGDQLVALLYWKDLLQGQWREFASLGVPVVCAGHIYDPIFMGRLHRILSASDTIVSNYLGTPIHYAGHLGKAVRLVDVVAPSGATDLLSFQQRFDRWVELRYLRAYSSPNPRVLLAESSHAPVLTPEQLCGEIASSLRGLPNRNHFTRHDSLRLADADQAVSVFDLVERRLRQGDMAAVRRLVPVLEELGGPAIPEARRLQEMMEIRRGIAGRLSCIGEKMRDLRAVAIARFRAMVGPRPGRGGLTTQHRPVSEVPSG